MYGCRNIICFEVQYKYHKVYTISKEAQQAPKEKEVFS
jgi:hypothetical protein